MTNFPTTPPLTGATSMAICDLIDDKSPPTDEPAAMNYPPSSNFNQLLKLTAPLVAGAEALTRHARQQLARADRKPTPGAALRPGPDTPLWNELARAASLQLRKRGEKAKLARVLGVSRQRLHMLLVSRVACPDAERALLLVLWLNARKAGLDPA